MGTQYSVKREWKDFTHKISDKYKFDINLPKFDINIFVP
jgi:hypothetical protein